MCLCLSPQQQAVATISTHRNVFPVAWSAAMLAGAMATLPAHGATLLWSGNGTTQGGAGTWDTTNPHFGTSGTGPFGTVWNNTTNAADSVTFGGATSTATLGTDITVRGLTFNNASSVFAGGFSLTTGVSTALAISCGSSTRATGGTISAPIVGTSGITLIGVAGPLVLTGSSTYTGVTTVSNNGDTQSGVRLNLGNGGTGGSIGSSSRVDVRANSIFCTNRSNSIVQGIHFPTITGSGSFIKAGAGTTILTAANTYSGSTSVTNGMLLVNGTIGSGPMTVAAAGAIGGIGKVSGRATISGTLSPGNATGVLTLGSLSLGSTSTSLIELPAAGTRGTDYDGVTTLNASGLTYGGAMDVAFGASLLPDSTSFVIFDFAGSASGSFSAISSTGYYAGTWTNNSDGTFSLAKDSQTLTFTQGTGILSIVPEPASLVIASLGIGLAAGVAVRCRRR